MDRRRTPEVDGHVTDVAIVHLGFLGTRHTALASADNKGMAFSHLATRGMGSVARSVKTTRVLGRYPEATPSAIRQKKPSSVLAFSPLPLGNAEHVSDNMGLVAMLTPYLLVIVSTTPLAQTQYKTARPKEVAAHSAMTAALAWFPSVRLKVPNQTASQTTSRVKLVYCWSNVLTVLEVLEVEPSISSESEGQPPLQFRSRSRWKASEAIVAVQWLGRSVLAVLTITQQLVILEDPSLRETNSSDLIQKHIYHVDLYSQQLNMLVEELDEEDASMHGVVADAFYMSFRAYKGRLFLLGFSEVSFGQLSNWADRLLALVEEGSYIHAIELATSYYTGEADKVSVGLPDDDALRHKLVKEKLLDMISASLQYTFAKQEETDQQAPDPVQLREVAGACVSACVSMGDQEYLFDEVYTHFSDGNAPDVFLETLESYVMEDDIQIIPPTIIKDLVSYYTSRALNSRLEELICHLNPRTMDLDQITGLCRRNQLYDALFYVWNQALGDYTSTVGDLLDLAGDRGVPEGTVESAQKAQEQSCTWKIFPYLSYILTGRVYPTGKSMDEDTATLAKADVYHFLFSSNNLPSTNQNRLETSYSNLQKVLDLDAPSFMSMLNEAFEDGFLDSEHDHFAGITSGSLTDAQKYGLSMKRQRIVSILLEVMVRPRYEAEDSIYLGMFIARNLAKFPQFILLPGHLLHRVLVGLCEYPAADVAEDCELSVEYLLSVYQPPDIQDLVPLLSKAGFFRVLRSIHRNERDYMKLVQTCFNEARETGEIAFECVEECLRESLDIDEKQAEKVRRIIEEHASLLLDFRDTTQTVAVLERYAPELHETMVGLLARLSYGQLSYLQPLLDPSEEDARRYGLPTRHPRKDFVELYVRLLCKHKPHNVNEYVERLKTGDLRLEEILPALESSGIIDAAVILMAREGKIKEAMSRLTRQLDTLEAALLGILSAAEDSPDTANTSEATHDLVSSIQKFSRLGVWLCQGETRSVQQRKLKMTPLSRARGNEEELSMNEALWLDLIDAVVKVTKHVSEAAQDDPEGREINGVMDITRLQTTVATDLRGMVQEAFTALLSATSGPRGDEAPSTDATFLRVLRAFLTRASASSPSLSNIRTVLGTIFSAYSYEERLLDLANRLLDKDLFVHIAEADTLRRRGWRPLGQVCEGCGKRVWGPGTGGYIWDAYQKSEAVFVRKRQQIQQRSGHVAEDQTRHSSRNGKGIAIDEDSYWAAVDQPSSGEDGDEVTATRRNDTDGLRNMAAAGSGPLIVFSCRHLFHRLCLEKMQGVGVAATNGRQDGPDSGNDFVCPLCIST